MQRSIVISGLLMVALSFSSAPGRAQETIGSQQYQPFIARGQSSASVHDHAPPEQRTQGTGVTFTVTKFTDSFDGICDADCSLREAISAANQHPGADIIPLISGVYQLTIPLPISGENTVEEDEIAIGDLDITDALAVIGAGVDVTSLANTTNDRVIEVLAGATVDISQLTITGGASDYDGGGLFNAGRLALADVQIVANHAGSYDIGGTGGGLYNLGTVTIEGSTIVDNFTATSGSAGASGGGIANDGTLDLVGSEIRGNYTSGSESYSVGGGIINGGTASIRDSTLAANTTESGGGALFNREAGRMTLVNVNVTDNKATFSRGALGHGGGIFNAGLMTVTNGHIQHNTLTHPFPSQSISSFGGGIYNKGSLTITQSVIANNITDGYQFNGGGIYNTSVLTITASTIANNLAGTAASNGDGGGLYSDGADSHVILQNSTISGNRSSNGGSGGGLWNSDGSTMTLINSTVSGNVSTGNGGGINNTRAAGLFTIRNSTITDNQAGWSGGGIWNDENSTLLYHNTIIAGNTAAASGADCQSEAILSSQGHNLVGNSTGCDSSASGDLTVVPTTVFPHVLQLRQVNEPGQTATHALAVGSPALDAGDDTVCPATDQRGVPRPQGSHCDIGAYEGTQQVTTNLLFVSSSSSGKAGDVKFRDEDIVAYDFASNAWQMVFDGSDVGVTKDVDAFAFRPDGSLLLSFNAPTDVPGLGKVDDSDIVQFTPTQLGSATAGSFAFYLHGADMGLTTDGEDIDAIGFSPDNQLIVSTIGDFHTETLTGKDEDLIQLDDASSGAWTMFLDGSTVGLANEDVNGFWLDPATGERYLTVKDSFAFTDEDEAVQIDSDDIFVCTPTQDGGCIYHRFWDSDDQEYGSENLDSIGLGALPASVAASGQADSTASPTPDELAADDDSDDFNAEEFVNQLFLPLVER